MPYIFSLFLSFAIISNCKNITHLLINWHFDISLSYIQSNENQEKTKTKNSKWKQQHKLVQILFLGYKRFLLSFGNKKKKTKIQEIFSALLISVYLF